jgi:hypothetical protein
MKRYGILAAAAAIGAMALTAAPGASAKAGDAVASGKCSGASTYKLKVGPRDAGLDTAFEVDSNVVGQTWNWKLKDNGGLVASGTKTTVAPSGSFTVHRILPDRAGSDTILAKATNPATGEVCTATVTV